MKLSICLLFLSLFGCVHNLHQDYAPAPIDMNKGRLETVVCGHYAIGDNVCWLSENEDPRKLEIDIQTYFSGMLFIKSDNCRIESHINYDKGQSKKIVLGEYLAGTEFPGFCVIDIMMSPNFPDQDKSESDVRAISGRVVLAKRRGGLVNISGGRNLMDGLDDRKIYPGVSLMSLPATEVFNVLHGIYFMPESESGEFILGGCDNETIEYSYDRGEMLSIPLIEYLDGRVPNFDHCVLYGRMRPSGGQQDQYLLGLVEIYLEDYIPLAKPILVISKDKVEFNSLEPISWTLLSDGQELNSGSGEFKLDGSIKDYRLVQLTARGRTLVMRIKDGHLIWSQ